MQVLSGEVAPDALVELPPEELASDAKRDENARIREKKLFDSAPSAVKLVRCRCRCRCAVLFPTKHIAGNIRPSPSLPTRPATFLLLFCYPTQPAAPQLPLHLQATTDQFQCGKCRQRKVTYYQMQTRSADEPVSWGGVGVVGAVAATVHTCAL